MALERLERNRVHQDFQAAIVQAWSNSSGHGPLYLIKSSAVVAHFGLFQQICRLSSSGHAADAVCFFHGPCRSVVSADLNLQRVVVEID
jgi:hypothetical protein